MRRRDFKIGTCVAFAFCPLVLLIAVSSVIGLTRISALNESFTRIVVDRHSKADLLHAVVGESNTIMLSMQQMMLSSEASQFKEELDKIAVARRVIGELLERLDAAFGGEGQKAKDLQQLVHNKHSAYLVSLARFARLAEGGKLEEARNLLNLRIRPELKDSLAAIHSLSALQTGAMRDAVAEAGDSFERAWNVILALAVFSIALAALIAFLTARGISRPLKEAVRVAQRVAAGDLASRIDARGKSETGQVMAALKRMNASLAAVVGEVRSSSHTIAIATRQLVSAGEDLSRRTEQHASSLEETASTMEQFAVSAVQNADNSRVASELAESVSKVATRGGEAMGRVVATMSSISLASKRIVDIVTFMDRIAFQTNILALNASVEAAHAGDRGRGFAAVAFEVRELSLRSAKAAKEIKALVAESVGEVEQGMILVGDAGRTIEEVVKGAREVARIMGDISVASGEQRTGIGQMNEVMAQMDEMTQQNAAMVEQMSAAMKVLEAQARGLVAAVRVFELGSDGEVEAEAHAQPEARSQDTDRFVSALPRLSLEIAGR